MDENKASTTWSYHRAPPPPSFRYLNQWKKQDIQTSKSNRITFRKYSLTKDVQQANSQENVSNLIKSNEINKNSFKTNQQITKEPSKPGVSIKSNNDITKKTSKDITNEPYDGQTIEEIDESENINSKEIKNEIEDEKMVEKTDEKPREILNESIIKTIDDPLKEISNEGNNQSKNETTDETKIQITNDSDNKSINQISSQPENKTSKENINEENNKIIKEGINETSEEIINEANYRPNTEATDSTSSQMSNESNQKPLNKEQQTNGISKEIANEESKEIANEESNGEILNEKTNKNHDDSSQEKTFTKENILILNTLKDISPKQYRFCDLLKDIGQKIELFNHNMNNKLSKIHDSLDILSYRVIHLQQ